MGICLLPTCLNLMVLIAMCDEPTHHVFRINRSSERGMDVRVMAYSPNSAILAVNAQRRLYLIDVRKGEILHDLPISSEVLCFASDSRHLYVAGGSDTGIVDLTTGQLDRMKSQLNRTDFGITLESRNGRLLIQSMHPGGPAETCGQLQAGDEIMAIAEGRTHKFTSTQNVELHTVQQMLKGFPLSYARLQILPKGKFAENHQKVVELRRSALESVPVIAESGLPQSSPFPGKIVALPIDGGELEIRLADTGMPITRLEPLDVYSQGVCAISSDDRLLATMGTRRNARDHAAEVYEIATHKRLAHIPLNRNEYHDLEFSATGEQLLLCGDDGIDLVSLGRNKPQASVASAPKRRTSSSRSSSRSSGEPRLPISKPEDLVEIRAQFETGLRPKSVWRIDVSRENVIAIAHTIGHISFQDLDSGAYLGDIPAASSNCPHVIEFSPDGNWLAYSVDGTLHLEDVSRFRKKAAGSVTAVK